MRRLSESDVNLQEAIRFNNAVTKAIRQNSLVPSHHPLDKLCDLLPEFARDIIRAAIGNSAHVSGSTFIGSGLKVLGLDKGDALPTPSQIQELDKFYHGKRKNNVPSTT